MKVWSSKPRWLACAAVLIATPCLADPTPSIPSAAAPAPAANASPSGSKADVSSVLFSGSHWRSAPVGTVITYDFAKTTTDAAFGPSFKDHVVMTLDKGESADTRTAEVKLFSGGNARAAGPFRSDEQNPVVLLILEENVQELSKIFKANPRYLKNAIRKAWRDNATIEPVTIDVGGKSVKGTRVAVRPFHGDPEADKMKGLQDLTYTVEVSDELPGYVGTVSIRPPGDKPTYSEELRYASVKTP